MTSPASCGEALRRFLLEVRNPDGGWGYYPGHQSRLEPTSWAHLALGTTVSEGTAVTRGPWATLGQGPRVQGLLVDASDIRPNLGFNGLATVALLQNRTAERRREARTSIDALVSHVGVTLPPSPGSSQDNSLEGWPWVDQTFSWVEPTGWCLLACKTWIRTSPAERALLRRIDSAERVLFDRVCHGGGWNYGNSTVLEQRLEPFVPTTALGLLALQDRRDHPVVVESLRRLEEIWPTQVSGMALSLTLICFAVFGLSSSAVERDLLDQWERFEFFQNVHVAAMALFALQGESNGVSAFRV